MEKLLNDLRDAAATLRLVAHGLRTPLDTSTFDKALEAVERGLAKPKAETKAFSDKTFSPPPFSPPQA